MCDHSPWVQVSRRPSLCFSKHPRLDRISDSLSSPEQQYPGVILGLGRKSRDAVFKAFFPHNNLSRRARDPAFADIYVDNTTRTSRNPLYFATCDSGAISDQQCALSLCHHTRTVFAKWPEPQGAQTLASVVLNKLLFPFCDIICLFLEDYGSLAEVIGLVISWISQGSASQFDVRPQVLLISLAVEHEPSSELLQVEDLTDSITRETPADYRSCFESIDLVKMPDHGLSAGSRFRPLKELVVRRMDEARNLRAKHKCLFSATHFAALYASRLPAFAKCTTAIFDAVRASREGNELPTGYVDILTTFMKLCIKHQVPYTDIASKVASSVLLNAYPPSMHRFDPLKLYAILFDSSISKALETAYDSWAFITFLKTTIKDQLQELFYKLEAGQSARDIHKEVLASQRQTWEPINSHRCCLFCLTARPEHVLPCSHSICDNCVRIFGRAHDTLDHSFILTDCMHCNRTFTFLAVLKPPTAGVRILSVDGGGVRGIIPLQFLNLLQRRLGSQCRVQDMFDLTVGTSAGGLIALGLFLKQWDVPHCIRLFRTLTRESFGEQGPARRSRLKRLKHYLKGLITDGCYDVGKIERALKSSFGETQKIFDCPEHRESRCKVAVTATTISDAITFLFSNYNGSAQRESTCGYTHYRPSEAEKEPMMWEAARATSAAPLIFRSVHIPSVGTFQDGGLRHNNPVNLALWESTKIWAADTPQDVILSLGTGSEAMEVQSSPKATKFRHILNDGFIPRLCRSFLSSLDGEHTWRDLHNRLTNDVKADFFRFNVTFKGAEPEIDDVSCMDSLVDSVSEELATGPRLTEIAIALLVSCLYFELDRAPEYDDGFLRCTGSIRCRADCRALSRALERLAQSPLTILMPPDVRETLDLAQSICPWCYRLCRKVSFTVRHPTEKVSINIGYDDKQRKVSGFPQCIDWFVEQQRLTAAFGRVDHSANFDGVCRYCEPYRRLGGLVFRKRKVAENSLAVKRRRIQFPQSSV